jgi:hypothetical protein
VGRQGTQSHEHSARLSPRQPASLREALHGQHHPLQLSLLARHLTAHGVLPQVDAHWAQQVNLPLRYIPSRQVDVESSTALVYACTFKGRPLGMHGSRVRPPLSCVDGTSSYTRRDGANHPRDVQHQPPHLQINPPGVPDIGHFWSAGPRSLGDQGGLDSSDKAWERVGRGRGDPLRDIRLRRGQATAIDAQDLPQPAVQGEPDYPVQGVSSSSFCPCLAFFLSPAPSPSLFLLPSPSLSVSTRCLVSLPVTFPLVQLELTQESSLR